MIVLEPPKKVIPWTMRVTCHNVACAAVLLIDESAVTTERGRYNEEEYMAACCLCGAPLNLTGLVTPDAAVRIAAGKPCVD